MNETGFNPLGPWAGYAQNGLPEKTAKENMPIILAHFVGCDWGGCYHGIFHKIIKPYLDNREALRTFLATPCIHGKGDIERSSSGELIFYDLFKFLMNVDSPDIREYLVKAFPGFAERFRLAPFKP
jgi:hypothetical protein